MTSRNVLGVNFRDVIETDVMTTGEEVTAKIVMRKCKIDVFFISNIEHLWILYNVF